MRESDLPMDLRSIKPGMAAAPLFMIHPQTGEMLTPLGHTKTGKPIWPVMGGAPEDEGGADDKDDDESDEDESEEDEDDDSDDDSEEDDDEGKSKKKKKGDPQAKIKALEEEKERHYKKFKAQKKRADDLEARLQALEEKDLKPEDKAQRDKDAQDRKDKANADRLAKLNLENAFLRANEIDWVNPTHALAILLADPDEYEIEFDDDGKVDRRSLRAELKRLAKANPHLVKPKKTESKGDEDGDDGSAPRATASTMNGKRKGKKDDRPTREQLARKFPVLGRLP